MEITVSYILIRVVIGIILCVIAGILQYRFRRINLIYFLLVLFVVGGVICLIISDEVLYILLTIYFIFTTAACAFIQLIRFIRDYRRKNAK
jgi:uncharacterized membrane protein